MGKRLNCSKYKKRGKEFNVPYYASTTAAYNSNMPYIIANRLIQRQFALYNNHLPLFLTLATLLL
jgi:hypothetical protein